MPEYDPSGFRGRQPWQYGDEKGDAEIDLDHDTAWWVERMVERVTSRTASSPLPTRGSTC